MCPKIWCDGECWKILQIFLQLNRALVSPNSHNLSEWISDEWNRRAGIWNLGIPRKRRAGCIWDVFRSRMNYCPSLLLLHRPSYRAMTWHSTYIEWGMVGVGRHRHGRERRKRPRCIARVDKEPAKPCLLLAFFVFLFLIVPYKDENGTKISRTEPHRFLYFIRSNSFSYFKCKSRKRFRHFPTVSNRFLLFYF
jgi:hypothetical protein